MKSNTRAQSSMTDQLDSSNEHSLKGRLISSRTTPNKLNTLIMFNYQKGESTLWATVLPVLVRGHGYHDSLDSAEFVHVPHKPRLNPEGETVQDRSLTTPTTSNTHLRFHAPTVHISQSRQ